MTYIILLGKPGSGKGTIASTLVNEHDFYHLSGSDLLRENSRDETAKYYKEARHALDTGILISSDIINGMVKEKLKDLKDKNIVFDGYPRTIQQIDFLLQNKDEKQEVKAIYLDIDDEVIKERIIHRLTCKGCNASFNKKLMKPKQEGICDHCGSELFQRVDDNEETLKTRLDQYTQHTYPVIEKLKKEVPFNIVKNSKEIII